MRKIFSFILSLSLTAGLTMGCSSQNAADSSSGSSGNESYASAEENTGSSSSDEQISEETAEGSAAEAAAPSQGSGTYTYDIRYYDNRLFECCVDVTNYIYTKDGEKYVNLLQMALDLGWTPRDEAFTAAEAVYRYGDSDEGVRLSFTGSERLPNDRTIYPSMIAAKVYIESDGRLPHIDWVVSTGLLSSDTDRELYAISTCERMSIDMYSLVLYAYCLDHLRVGTELPVPID